MGLGTSYSDNGTVSRSIVDARSSNAKIEEKTELHKGHVKSETP